MQKSVDVLSFLGGLRDARELVAALARHCNEAGLESLRRFAGVVSAHLSAESQQHLEVTHDMLLIAQLCGPQDISAPCFAHDAVPSAIGQLAVQLIATTVLGPQTASLDERSLTMALAISTVSHVLAARHMCLAALQASVSPINCFTLFRFATETGVSPLRVAAQHVCLACVPTTTLTAAANATASSSGAGVGSATAADVKVDVAGFRTLAQAQLESLLQSNALQVSSESAVFEAVETWVAASPLSRLAQRADLVRSCVRLDTMALRELEVLDQSASVVASNELTRIVAQAYVMRIMGVKGLTVQTPRPSVVEAADAAAMAATEGMAAAAGSPAGRVLQQMQTAPQAAPMLWVH